MVAITRAIKHADIELDHFIASNQLEEPIMTSLVARKTLLGHYWTGASDD